MNPTLFFKKRPLVTPPTEYVATRNIRNLWPQWIRLKDTPHEGHIPRGSRFALDEVDQRKATVARSLLSCGAIVRADDGEAVARVDAAIASDAKWLQEHQKRESEISDALQSK